MVWREHFTNGRTFTGGSGLAVVAAASSAQIGGWHHWTAIGFLYGVGVVLVVLSAALIAKSYYAPQSAPRPIIRVPALLPIEGLQLSGMKWQQQHAGPDAVIAVVSNYPSASPGKGGKASGLAASLNFSDWSGSLIYVPKAHWLDKLENAIDMSVGDSQRLLIGLVEDDYFRVFHNRYESDPRKSEEGKNVIYVNIAHALRFSDDLSVAIQVYSVDTGEIYTEQSFRIPHGNEIVNAQRKKSNWTNIKALWTS